LRQGLAFRGHDETKNSFNKGNFRELLAWLADNFEEVNMVVLENAPKNCQMIDHKIQKDLIEACAHETTKFIIEELVMSVLQFLLMSQVMHTNKNNWLFVCVMSIKKESQLSDF
jgi:hypothetical protein